MTDKFTYAIGRRKTASARVRLFKGKGENTVNGKRAVEVFSGKVLSTKINLPLTSNQLGDKFYFTAVVNGGGKEAQLDAVLLGVSRALIEVNPDLKPKLRRLDLMTRDSRTRQRRMVGTGGKSRRRKQSPKR